MKDPLWLFVNKYFIKNGMIDSNSDSINKTFPFSFYFNYGVVEGL